MSKSHQTMMSQMAALSSAGVTAFRNNSGVGWAGVGKPHIARRRETVTLNPGDVVIRQGRPLTAGLCKGSSDIIALTPIKISPHHVGKTLAVFSAIESKSGTGRLEPDQVKFIDHVNSVGGMAGVAYSDDEAILVVSRYGEPVKRKHE